MSEWLTKNIISSTGGHLASDIGGPEGAPAVVLMHGGGQTRFAWSGAMRQLVDRGYRVLNYDARGHGESDWSSNGDYSLPVLADDLDCVLRMVGRPVALVGASMGGMTAFYGLGRSDSRIADALILVDIVPRPAPGGAEKIVAFMAGHLSGFASLDDAAAAVAAYTPERRRSANPEGLNKNLRLRADGRLYWHWDPAILSVSPSTEPPAFVDLALSVARKITVPTMLVRGLLSDVVDDAGVAELRDLLPNTEVYDIAGAGHMVAGDQNDAFNVGINDFLCRNMPALAD